MAFSSNPDLRILAFNIVLTLAVSVLFSLAPAFQFWRPNPAPALKQQASTVARGSLQLRRAMVVAQIGLSLLLLVGAGLFVRTLNNLKSLSVGFTTDNLVTFTIDPRLAGYAPGQDGGLYERTLEELAKLPGVRFATATSDPELMNNNTGSNITVAGYHPGEGEDMNVEWERVSSGYFTTLQMSLLEGREITDQDRLGTQKVAVVNESFARQYFGGAQSAVGHYFGRGGGDVKTDIQIVGVVKDARHTGIREDILRSVFTPYLQEQQTGTNTHGMTFYVRTWQAPENAETTIRQAMHMFDSKL